MIYIATTAYNAEHTIKQCIESVLNQTSGEFIYYLCDNGSTDATGDIIRSYAQKDSRIKPFLMKKIMFSKEQTKSIGIFAKN